ncbi:MAG: class I SAM-dependent methyltransferase [Burkholderiaceae bacterium]|nr:MAG: class I SAM-dependent methyltransferase [Burkholderiaceae bacterium]TBR75620.1 MAG: class I SAM-dependent methyltransferase [Burkholderiaceae bacterium]
MNENASIQFFDQQFRRQVAAVEYVLNPFESAALPHLHGRVLDYGCGLGNLAVEAARKGCSVLALDASHAAIKHLRAVAEQDRLPLRAEEADLRTYELTEDFDVIVCIGLLMFFDCPTAYHQLSQLQDRVRPGGSAVVNVLTEGTTYMDMFAPEGHCLFNRSALRAHFAQWEIVSFTQQEFPAPNGTRKVFETIIARKPCCPS